MTRRVRSDDELWIRSEAIDSSIDGIAFASLDGRISSVNGAFLRLWGYDDEREVVGRPAVEFWRSPEAAAEVLSRTSEAGGAVGELEALRRDGTTFVAELSASIVRDAEARPVALMGSFIDVTARVRATEALREGEERLRQALRVADFGIFDHDQVADRIYWSPRQREIYGVGPDEEITLPLYMAAVYPDDRGRIGEAVRWAHDPASGGAFDVEHRITRRDGAIRWLTTRAQTFFVGEGATRRPVRTVGAVRDVTEVRLAEEERERLREQLGHAQRLESVGRLAGGVAHDFNNMLAVILGTVELIRGRLDGPAWLTADLVEIERAALHARDVTRQLLAFSRRQVISPRAVDLNELLASTRRTLARLIGEDVRLEVLPAPDLWPVRLDPFQVDQILVNLAVNARDAMPSGGRLTIETANVHLDEAYCRANAGFTPGDHVLLAVSDDGEGIPREVLPRIFEPFFTTKPVGRGTGLGLATVYGIVAQNGGTIHVYSEPGQGTSFKIYLPRMAEGEPADAAAAPRAAIPPGRTVLLVEDDEMVRRMVTGMLRALGVEVVACGGWRDALERAQRADLRLDLVLSDVVMPEMSGKALRDRILEIRPGLPVLFMSGYTPNVIVHHGVLEAGVRLLQKPFGQEELARAVAEALGAQHA
jgi:PAS domain S-box-containing protein